MRLLLVEDDPQLGPQLKTALQQAGYAVDLATDGIDAEALGDIEPYDLAVLDLGLPGRSGLAVLEHWRAGGNRLPVQLPGIFTFICICFLVLAYYSARNAVTHTGAVVMQNDAPLMNNNLKGKPLALIPEGVTVKIKDENGQWIEVTLPDGRTGWLPQNVIEKI